jgi:predicted aconitase with swiveling domain
MIDSFQPLVPGSATGPAAVLTEPLSLWGGLDPDTGTIIDAHHPQRGSVIVGSVLVMPFGRGSSSSASTLLEAVRLRTHPTAILLAQADDILVVGSIVAKALYGITVPIVVLPRSAYGLIRPSDEVEVAENRLAIRRAGKGVVSLRARNRDAGLTA